MFKNLGLTLRLLREFRGLKQAALAKRAGLGKSQLSKYENGREEPKLAQLGRLLEALGVSLLDLALALEWVSSGQGEQGIQAAQETLPPTGLLSQTIQSGFEELQGVIMRLHRTVIESNLAGVQKAPLRNVKDAGCAENPSGPDNSFGR